jgi:hypothetical protein
VNFAAVMRVGSLEILGGLAAFGLLAARLHGAPAQSRPKAVSLAVRVREAPAFHAGAHDLALTIAETAPCLIGRSRDADVELGDPEVSRRHARLELVRGVVYVSDDGSRNGTFLNEKPLGGESIELRPGDDIDVGNTRITIIGMEPVR